MIGYEPSTVFYILTQVLNLKFRHWRWLPHLLSDDQKVARVNGAKVLQQELLDAKKRNCDLFWTGDKSWILWHNERLGSWLAVDQELPIRVRQTIGWRKFMLIIFFNPRAFAVINVLPPGTLFNAAYFVSEVIIPLHQLHSIMRGDNERRKLRVHFDNSPCHTARKVSEEMSHLRCRRVPHPPYSPNLAICDFYLFDRIKKRLAGVTGIDENDLRNEITAILGEISEEEKMRAFDH
jgi:histone-lysine N-methyltransferase SETMAR